MRAISCSQRNHNYDEMTKWLQKYAADYPKLAHLSSAGRSVQSRELWVMMVGADVNVSGGSGGGGGRLQFASAIAGALFRSTNFCGPSLNM